MNSPSDTKSGGGVRRVSAIVGTAIFLVIAPGFFCVVAPWWMSGWRFGAPFFGIETFRYIGGALIAVGAPVLLESFARFAIQGIGTPAPVFPTQHLVVKGFYRFVRNPMYISVISIVLGQGLLFSDVHVLEYGAGAWLATHIFVLLYEEPTLRRTFGEEYEMYCANVRRWLPRLTPWREPNAD
jgi:protein-S-isoprenylcysteine O-methyltransferase Ste14